MKGIDGTVPNGKSELNNYYELVINNASKEEQVVKAFQNDSNIESIKKVIMYTTDTMPNDPQI
jgi:hypothetical protein